MKMFVYLFLSVVVSYTLIRVCESYNYDTTLLGAEALWGATVPTHSVPIRA